MISTTIKNSIQENLLSWYDVNQRELPWRETSDPYRIWVSEIMLQQTKVETVIPYYNKFIELFPTVQDLADAPEEQVLKAWEGLGYYSRVRNLLFAAKQVVSEYGGVVPSDPEELSTLKGIGPYTKGAILSIAYNKSFPAIDGNVMRVISRLFTLYEDIMLTSTKKKMEFLVTQLIPEMYAGNFNQALMELGATICSPTLPQCLFCPLKEVCMAYAKGVAVDLPIKKKAKAQVKKEVVFLGIWNQEKLLIEKRSDKGMLAGLWGLPTLQKNGVESSLETLRCFGKRHNLFIISSKEVGSIRHIFTHQIWDVVVVEAKIGSQNRISNEWEWVDLGEISTKAFPVVYQKAMQMLLREI